MPTATLRVTWRGRVRALLRDARSDLNALVNYNEKPAVQPNRPLFTIAQLATVADTINIITALLALKTPR